MSTDQAEHRREHQTADLIYDHDDLLASRRVCASTPMRKFAVVAIFVLLAAGLHAETPENLAGVWITNDGTELWEFEVIGQSAPDADVYANAVVGVVTVTNVESGYSQYYGWAYKHYTYFVQWTYNNYHAHSIDRRLDKGLSVGYTENIGMDLIAPKCVYEGRRWKMRPRVLYRSEVAPSPERHR